MQSRQTAWHRNEQLAELLPGKEVPQEFRFQKLFQREFVAGTFAALPVVTLALLLASSSLSFQSSLASGPLANSSRASSSLCNSETKIGGESTRFGESLSAGIWNRGWNSTEGKSAGKSRSLIPGTLCNKYSKVRNPEGSGTGAMNGETRRESMNEGSTSWSTGWSADQQANHLAVQDQRVFQHSLAISLDASAGKAAEKLAENAEDSQAIETNSKEPERAHRRVATELRAWEILEADMTEASNPVRRRFGELVGDQLGRARW
jgi:uncharacterized membrane protein